MKTEVQKTTPLEEALALFKPYMSEDECLVDAASGTQYVFYILFIVLGPFFAILWRPYLLGVTDQAFYICKKSFFGYPIHIDKVAYEHITSLKANRESKWLYRLQLNLNNGRKLDLNLYHQTTIFEHETPPSALEGLIKANK